jgi:hypothetical protein
MSKRPHLGTDPVSRSKTKFYGLIPVGPDGRFVIEHIPGEGDYDGNKIIKAKNPKKLGEAIMKMLGDPRYGDVIVTAASDL